MKTSPRSQKFASIIHDKIGPIIHDFLSPKEIGFLTVTAVEVSGDLEWTHVFVSSLNPPGGWLKNLNNFNKKISHELLKRIEKRRSLMIQFKVDKGVAHAEKLKM